MMTVGRAYRVANKVEYTLYHSLDTKPRRKNISGLKENQCLTAASPTVLGTPDSYSSTERVVDSEVLKPIPNAGNSRLSGPATVESSVVVTPSYKGSALVKPKRAASWDLFGEEPPSLAGNSPLPLYTVAKTLSGAGGIEKRDDITLIGKNGVRVRAFKNILASHSPLLQEKLFSKQTPEEVYIGNYSESALRVMHDYCHSTALRQSRLASQKCASAIGVLAELASLAITYQVDHLYCEADMLICEILEEHPMYATAAFDALGNGTETLEACLVQFIKEQSPALLMETDALKYLGKKRLLDLLNALNCCWVVGLTYILKWMEMTGNTSTTSSVATAVSTDSEATLTAYNTKSTKSKRRRSSKSKGQLDGYYHQLTLTGDVAICCLDTDLDCHGGHRVML